MLRPLLLATPVVWLTACASSYHAMQVRVVSSQGGGIANATVHYHSGSSNEGDIALTRTHATSWTTDAAGRARLQASDGGAAWHIRAPGFRPLIVNGSPDEIRIKQYGRRGGNHDAEPVIFVLEPAPPNAASDPKQFESQVDKQPKAQEQIEGKKPIGPKQFES